MACVFGHYIGLPLLSKYLPPTSTAGSGHLSPIQPAGKFWWPFVFILTRPPFQK